MSGPYTPGYLDPFCVMCLLWSTLEVAKRTAIEEMDFGRSKELHDLIKRLDDEAHL